MTGRTHDLAAFTALSYVIVSYPPADISLATALVAFSANLIGGLTPDIDQPTADLWHRIPAGNIIGKLISPLLGGHRFISHSIIGVFLFAFLMQLFLDQAKHVLLVNMDVVWWSFMIGYVSHLFMDTITKEGVPWFFPIPWKIGFPPLKIARVRTGGLIEKYIIFPGLLAINAYLYYSHYHFFLTFLHTLIK